MCATGWSYNPLIYLYIYFLYVHLIKRNEEKKVLLHLPPDEQADLTWPGSRDHRFRVSLPPFTCPSLDPSDLHPQLFRLITPNVILIKNCGVKGFSLPEKRVQIVAQWHTPSLAWEEMHPDIARVVPTRPEPGWANILSGSFKYHNRTLL